MSDSVYFVSRPSSVYFVSRTSFPAPPAPSYFIFRTSPTASFGLRIVGSSGGGGGGAVSSVFGRTGVVVASSADYSSSYVSLSATTTYGRTIINVANLAALFAILGTGTPSGTTFLRGDGTWSTPAGTGDVVGPGSAVSGHLAVFSGTTGKLISDGGAVPTQAVSSVFSRTGTVTAQSGDYSSFYVSSSGTNSYGLNLLTTSNIASLITAMAATGTASSTTFLRGDGAWAAPSGGGNVTGPVSSTTDRPAFWSGTSGTVLKDSVVGWLVNSDVSPSALLNPAKFATQADQTFLANFSGSTAAPSAYAVSSLVTVLETTFDSRYVLASALPFTTFGKSLINTANLAALFAIFGSGTPSSTTYLRGDGSWVAPPGAVTAFNTRTGSITPQSSDYSSFFQATSPALTSIAGLTLANDDVLQVKAGAVTQRTPAQLKTDLAIASGDVSGLGSLATKSAVASADITDGTILNIDINASAGIVLSKLATDPLARANHTGTQTASTVSDFDTQVHTSRLDQLAVPTANVSLNTHKLTNVVDPTSNQDAATKKYVDDTSGGGGGGTQTVWPVRWYDQIDDDSTPPSGIPDLTADGVTLVAGDRVAGNLAVWEIASGTWTQVHVWAVGDLMLVTADTWDDASNGEYAAAYIIGDSVTPSALLTGQFNYLQNTTFPSLVTTTLGTTSIDALADVSTSTAPTGAMMYFDGGTWIPTPVPSLGSVLFFDGANWNNVPGSPNDLDTIRWSAANNQYNFGP